MQIIPITNSFNQSFETVLNGVEVRFIFWFQDIGSGWFCSMEFIDETAIVSGARLNTSSPLLASTVSDFEGDIVPVSALGNSDDIGREPWGNTHVLLYLTPEELEEVGLIETV